LRRLGDAAHLLGMTPRDWDLVTVEEADLLLDWLDAYTDEMAAQEAKLRG
jgi:hypothetical protein